MFTVCFMLPYTCIFYIGGADDSNSSVDIGIISIIISIIVGIVLLLMILQTVIIVRYMRMQMRMRRRQQYNTAEEVSMAIQCNTYSMCTFVYASCIFSLFPFIEEDSSTNRHIYIRQHRAKTGI